MNTDTYIEKIRKLLRLAKSSNQAEAALALAKAMELSARHQIDMNDLAEDDEIAKLVTRYFRCGGSRLQREWREALGVARKFFNVSTCIMRGMGKVAFIGTESDVQIADYVTAFLVKSCRAELALFAQKEKKARRVVSANKRASFINAFYGAIWLNLVKQRNEQYEVISGFEMVLKSAEEARDAHMKADLGETRTLCPMVKAPQVKSALYAGYDAGFKTRINPALGTDAPLELDYSVV